MTADTIISDLKDLVSAVEDMESTVEGFNSPLQVVTLGLFEKTQKVKDAIQKGHTDAQQMQGRFSASDSSAILDYVEGSLLPEDAKASEMLKTKKPLVDASLTTLFVRSNLNEFLEDYQVLSADVFEFVDPSQLDRAKQDLGEVQDSIQDAIDFYA